MHMIVGERLSQLRKDRGLLQKDLAKVLNVSKKSISMYERELRSPPDDIKIKLSTYFNVSIDYLMGLTDVEQYDDKRYLVLPDGISDDAKLMVNEFAEYLSSKYN